MNWATVAGSGAMYGGAVGTAAVVGAIVTVVVELTALGLEVGADAIVVAVASGVAGTATVRSAPHAVTAMRAAAVMNATFAID